MSNKGFPARFSLANTSSSSTGQSFVDVHYDLQDYLSVFGSQLNADDSSYLYAEAVEKFTDSMVRSNIKLQFDDFGLPTLPAYCLRPPFESLKVYGRNEEFVAVFTEVHGRRLVEAGWKLIGMHLVSPDLPLPSEFVSNSSQEETLIMDTFINENVDDNSEEGYLSADVQIPKSTAYWKRWNSRRHTNLEFIRWFIHGEEGLLPLSQWTKEQYCQLQVRPQNQYRKIVSFVAIIYFTALQRGSKVFSFMAEIFRCSLVSKLKKECPELVDKKGDYFDLVKDLIDNGDIQSMVCRM